MKKYLLKVSGEEKRELFTNKKDLKKKIDDVLQYIGNSVEIETVENKLSEYSNSEYYIINGVKFEVKAKEELHYNNREITLEDNGKFKCNGREYKTVAKAINDNKESNKTK